MINFSNCDKLTVDAFEVGEFYEDWPEDTLDELLHFDDVSVVETDATLYVDRTKKYIYRRLIDGGMIKQPGIKDQLQRWLTR